MSRYLFFVLVLISTFVFSMAEPVLEACHYSVVIETGNQGTTSNASLVFSADGLNVSFDNVGGSFQANSKQFFWFNSSCLKDVCDVTLISDGSGDSPNWFVESVGVLVYRISNGQTNPIPFIYKMVSFKTLLSPRDSLTATRRTCSYPPDNEEDCFYNVYIQTGDPGTDSNVGLEFSADGNTSSVGNLRPYGTNGPVYPYFQANNTDNFRYHRPCLSDVSNATLKSDGTGRNTSWFVESLGVLVYKTHGGKPEPIPFILKTCSFNALLSREGSLTASATACSDISSAVEIDGVPLGGNRAYDE